MAIAVEPDARGHHGTAVIASSYPDAIAVTGGVDGGLNRRELTRHPQHGSAGVSSREQHDAVAYGLEQKTSQHRFLLCLLRLEPKLPAKVGRSEEDATEKCRAHRQLTVCASFFRPLRRERERDDGAEAVTSSGSCRRESLPSTRHLRVRDERRARSGLETRAVLAASREPSTDIA
jgi:hypothetical protein